VSIIIDPEAKEIDALRRVARWHGARVLEIGCGDGRLTLRPGAKHRHVGIWRAGHWQAVGTMRETFEDDQAANAAVADVLHQGLFRLKRHIQFELKRYMDTLTDFRAWLDEFSKLAVLAPHDWLVQPVDRMLKNEAGRANVVVRGPFDIRVLKKIG